MTKSSNGQRKSALDAYVNFDLLGFHTNSNNNNSRLRRIESVSVNNSNNNSNSYTTRLFHMLHPERPPKRKQVRLVLIEWSYKKPLVNG